MQSESLKVEPLIDRKLAAKILGVDEQTLWRWVKRHPPMVPFYAIGNRIKFKVSELSAFIESRKNAKT